MVHSGRMRWKRHILWGNKVAGKILERLPVLSLFKNAAGNSYRNEQMDNNRQPRPFFILGS